MFQKSIALWFSSFLLCTGVAVFAQTESPEWALSERLIDNIDFAASMKASFKVSPDGRRVAYGVRSGGKQRIVVDGKEEKLYDAVVENTLVFSPDSKRVAYGVRTGNQWCMVVDGKEEKHYDALGVGTLVFSPDGKRVAYGVRTGSKECVVVDGKEEKQYDAIVAGTLVFSPKGRHLAYEARAGARVFVVMDGKEGSHYDAIIALGTNGEGRIMFDSANSLHYLAAKGQGIYLVEEGMK